MGDSRLRPLCKARWISVSEEWWLLLKANPRSRREMRELQQMKEKIDSQLQEDAYNEYNPHRLQAFARQLARDHSVARRNVNIRPPREERRRSWNVENYQPAERFQEEPFKTQAFDAKAGSMQPHLTAHVVQQPRRGDEMNRLDSIEELDHPLNPLFNEHGAGTPARLEAERVWRERGGVYR